MALDPAVRFGSTGLWARAQQALAARPPLPPPAPVSLRSRTTRPKPAAALDPLGIEILGPAPVVRPLPGDGCDYGTVGSIAELREYLRPCFEPRLPFGSDWETTSLNTAIAVPVGLSVSATNTSARYVPVGHCLSPGDNLPEAEVRQVLQDLDAAKATSLWYNTHYDLEVQYRRWGWEPVNWHDVQIAVFLVNSNVIELNLKTTALRLLGRKMQAISDLDTEWVRLSIKDRKTRSPLLPHQLPVETVSPYACDDACCTRALWFHPQVQTAILEQRDVFQLEEAFVPVLREGNRHGVYLDMEQLKRLQQEALGMLATITPEILRQLGNPDFTLGQRAKLGTRLAAIGALGENPLKTKGGQFATNKHVLDRLRGDHPIISQLIQYAELEAQERTYIRKLIKAAEYFSKQPWAEGRVRFAFGQIGVPTGRMKCGGAGKGTEAFQKGVVDLNGQSLPDHEKAPYLPNTRSGIVAPPGYVIVAADYSQIELRLPANLAKEPVWIEAFNTGKDIHVANAQVIANVREPGVVVTKSDKMRRGKAKTTSFALLYGGDEHTISRNAGVSVEEGKAIQSAFLRGLPRLKHWIDQLCISARRHKRVSTWFGRIRHLDAYFLPEPERGSPLWRPWKKLDSAGCREAVNDPVQGGAADIFKLACVILRKAIRAKGWGPDIISPQVYWVHDEVVFYVKTEYVAAVVPTLKAAMEFNPKPGQWPVPLKADFEVSSRLLYAEEKAAQAAKDGDAPAMTRWRTVAAGPEHCNYGELVALEGWLARYGHTQQALPAPEMAVSA
jgi:DNA polymerase-1